MSRPRAGTNVDQFFANLGLGGQQLKKIQSRKGKRWGVFLTFSNKRGFFMGNYIPAHVKPYAEPKVILKYQESFNEILYIDYKTYMQYKAQYDADKQAKEGGKLRAERSPVHEQKLFNPEDFK